MNSFASLYRARASHPRVLQAFSTEHPDDWYSPPKQALFASTFEAIYRTQFPPSEAYTLSLLKRYGTLVEGSGAPLEDDTFAEVLASFVLRDRAVQQRRGINSGDAFVDKDELCYVSFSDSRLGGVVGFRVAPYANDVGLRIWEAGYYLAEFLLANPHLVQGKKVLELGAGCGLTGLACCQAGAEAVHMTDYTDATIANMNHNIMLNSEWLGDAPISAGYLNWVEIAASDLSSSSQSIESLEKLADADVLIAADCIYDVDFLPHLVSAVEKLLALNKERGKVAYFASTLRNEKTFDIFIQQLTVKNIQYREILFQSDETTEIFPCFAVQGRDEIKLHEFRLPL